VVRIWRCIRSRHQGAMVDRNALGMIGLPSSGN
jgi:hypothetical protein